MGKIMEIHRALLRGLMTRKEIVSDGKRLLGLGAALASAQKDTIPPAIKKSECSEVSATGMLDQLSRLLDQLSPRITEGFHEAKHLESWVEVAREQLNSAHEALSNGCAEQAVLAAIQGTLGVYDILAELHTIEIVRDRARQRGTRKGGSKTPKSTTALQELIRSMLTDWPNLKARECWDRLQAYESSNPYRPSENLDLELYADGGVVFISGSDKPISFRTFRYHFDRIKTNSKKPVDHLADK